MKQQFIIRRGNDRLLLFFAGWGSDDHLFNRPVPEGYDYLLCYAYHDLEFDYTLLEGYTQIRLIAWSMGVWVAGRVLAGHSLPWQTRLAVCGTPAPIDDERGIPEEVFQATLDRFSEQTLARFRRRICGGTGGLQSFLKYEPYRPADDLRNELAALQSAVCRHPRAPFRWDRAFVARHDKIFPASNQLRAWADTPTCLFDGEHYDDELLTGLMSGKEEAWTSN